MVLFVGDRPSRLNKDPEVAFIGSRSEKVLMSWIKKINPTEAFLINSHTHILLLRIEVYNNLGDAVVALGNIASKRLEKAGIPHFKLPHPSGRNRKLNDKTFIDKELKKCKTYLRGLGKCADTVRT